MPSLPRRSILPPCYHEAMRCMMMLACAALAGGQGTDPKPKLEEYESHAQSRIAGVGAEYMVHSFSGEGRMFIAQDYLVVEVALFPPKGHEINVRPFAFSLRI